MAPTYSNGQEMVSVFFAIKVAIHAYMWSWGKPVTHLMQYNLLQLGVAKVKPLMNSNMTLTVLNLHQKTPKCATTKIQVKRYERY